ncbi:Fatty acid oxidation complex subunit alpha [Pseudoalteromonas holothuriae]|uniref:Fatty acid oxidation complex subunit alpha n=1 Tax=Pseudoalteromonas holothuriae TaxID=2963714 RepID=A0A9W4W0V0_9GAMM|nr:MULTISPECIES: crotonase/enoyl-CoA hydratase family protein [unclassified Pseudoalteromonas]CAH9050653.1 Fatty acid oxidation complex subunit alpha [Pseudoalteromonas sp. CIP111854]CAH9059644.1 Fatty acid oxidation complex subunit alpha [Pseudoalteromonas sp. CIP111951]
MLSLDYRDNVAWITLNRPEKQNALTLEMFIAIDKTVKQLKKKRHLRAVIIQGAGGNFCSGLDVKSVMKKPSTIFKLLFKWLPGNANLAQRACLAWHSLPVPVIALIDGNCFGGGLHIALGADFRIATHKAQLAIMESKWGLCPDMGSGAILPHLLSYDKALRLATLGTSINSSNALELGLLTEVSDNLQASCEQLLAQLLIRSPDTLSAIKRVNQTAYRQNLRATLAKETFAQLRLLMNKNTKVAMYNATHDELKSYSDRKKW